MSIPVAVVNVALGVACKELYQRVKDVVHKSTQFKSSLRKIKLTLDLLYPLIKKMEDCNTELGNPKTELEILEIVMQDGSRLVDKLLKVRKWNFFKAYYNSKLLALDDSLRRLFNILQAQQGRDMKVMLVEVKQMKAAVNRIEQGMKRLNQKELGWAAARKPPSFTVGLEAPLRELKVKLLKDNDVSVLLLTAPGGCGKTTLAQMFCHDKEVQERFKGNIFFVTGSIGSNFDWLQTGDNPALLVVDDFGSDSSSESLDEFYEFSEGSNCKILVTSRSRCQGRYSLHLEPLTDDEAMALFSRSASLEDKCSHIPKKLVKEVLDHCKRFPIAIISVGKSLFGKSIETWKEKAKEFSEVSSILRSQTGSAVYEYLKTSLDALSKEKPITKECFIDLASFPEGQRIPAAALIDMWAELYPELDQDFMSVANLDRINERSLANIVVLSKDKKEGDGYYSEHFVIQHGLLRDLAIQQTGQDSQNQIEQGKRLIIDICGNELPKWWTEQINKPKKTRLLSISTDGVFSSSWHNMQLPKAEVLVLNFQTENYELPKFREELSNSLKVLVVTNFGFLPAELSKSYRLHSLSSLKRIRLERISISSISLTKKTNRRIPYISKNSLQLKSVEKISLFMCKIDQASESFIQVFVAFPNLVEINIDYCNDLVVLPANLCDLVHLKKFSITNCHKLLAMPEEIGKLVNLEVLRVRCCTELVKLPDSIKKLQNVNILDISDCISIKELPEDVGQMSGLRKINMRQCTRLQELPPSICDLEETLEEVICDEGTERLWDPILPRLKKVVIRVVKEEHNLDWLH
ncbi:hypothetical protein ABKV19_007300 [Rosa sericea]